MLKLSKLQNINILYIKKINSEDFTESLSGTKTRENYIWWYIKLWWYKKNIPSTSKVDTNKEILNQKKNTLTRKSKYFTRRSPKKGALHSNCKRKDSSELTSMGRNWSMWLSLQGSYSVTTSLKDALSCIIRTLQVLHIDLHESTAI